LLKTIDHYLFTRYVQTALQIFIALFGMFVVIDGFTNFDNFQDTLKNASLLQFWGTFLTHYARQSVMVFQLTGTTLGLIAMLVVLVQLRRGELYPILSSGVPTRRLAAPLLWGVLVLNGFLMINQEFLLPKLADSLQVVHGQSSQTLQKVSPTYDRHRIYFDGETINPARRRIEHVAVTLPFPSLSTEPVTLFAEVAKWMPRDGSRPAGWLLGETTPGISQLPLTELGRSLIGRIEQGVFIASDMTADQMRPGRETSRYLSTRELADRVRNPSPGTANLAVQIYDLHSRLTTPLMNLGLVFIVMPLILRRESNSMINDIFTALLLVGAIGLLMFVGQFLASYEILRPDLAAWLPLITTGVTAAMFAPLLKT